VPGVRSVGLAFAPPLGHNSVRGAVQLLDRPEPEPGDEARARWHAVYASGQLVDLLYDTEPLDPFVFTAAAAVLALVAIAALMVPAARASRIEPMRVLKQG
jgi:hypothetical protein